MTKLFTKKLALVMALLMVFSSFALFGCGKDDSADDGNTTAATETDTNKDSSTTADEVTTDSVTEDVITVTSAEDAEPIKLAKSYKPAQAFKSGEEVGLDVVFGSGYKEYGGELVFNEDGTFSAAFGVTAGPDTTTGTYKIVPDTATIELVYNNDTTETASLITTDLENNVIELSIVKDGYTVIFKKG